MLTLEQRELIIKAFFNGLSDAVTAKVLPGVNYMQVFNFRKKMGITMEMILENRYKMWCRLIQDGVDLNVIAELYNVKPVSIRVMLSRKLGKSISEIREEGHAKKGESLKKRLSKKRPFDWA